MSIVGELIVLNQAPVALLVFCDDRKDRVIAAFREGFGLLVLPIGANLFLYHFSWNDQFDPSINDTSLGVIEFSIVLKHRNAVSEKLRRFRSGMGDQGFRFRKFQQELLVQKRPDCLISSASCLGPANPSRVRKSHCCNSLPLKLCMRLSTHTA